MTTEAQSPDFGAEGIVAANPDRELSFGERAVGLQFNPSGDPSVYRCKTLFAQVIDQMHDLCENRGLDIHEWRIADTAATQAMAAQMWAVKALTWKA